MREKIKKTKVEMRKRKRRERIMGILAWKGIVMLMVLILLVQPIEGVRIGTLNIGDGLVKKWDQILKTSDELSLDILGIQETRILPNQMGELRRLTTKYDMFGLHMTRSQSEQVSLIQKADKMVKNIGIDKERGLEIPANLKQIKNKMGIITLIRKNTFTIKKKIQRPRIQIPNFNCKNKPRRGSHFSKYLCTK